jgi:myo-inositol 2-dehydrogenase/D-chiro-inositol 1-dehydrogenase
MTMRVGIAGTGTMGEVHAAAWRSTDAELIGCTSTRLDQAEALARRYQMRVLSDYAELLNAVEIVDICTPTPLHKPMVLQAAKAGKHVICEKPVALTPQDARTMILACKEAGVRFFVGMVVRFFPQYRLAKELVANGQIGRLGVLRLKRVSYVPQKSPDNWYFDPTLSGGMVVDLMIHDFDYSRWLAGEVERVYAQRSRSVGGQAQYIQGILRFRSGAIALVEGGWAYPPGVFRTALDLSGTDGLIEWNSDQPSPVLTFLPPKPNDTASVGLPDSGLGQDPYAAEIQHAYRAIQTGTDFEVTAEDALEALRISRAAEESLSIGRPVLL